MGQKQFIVKFKFLMKVSPWNLGYGGGGGGGGELLHFLVSENHGSILSFNTYFKKFHTDFLII